jgi:hypothetical protein
LDWIAISSGDGMHTRVDPNDSRWVYTTSEWGGVFRTDQTLGTRVSIRPTRPGGDPAPYRSIWGTPLELSPHNGSILYTGGEMLLISQFTLLADARKGRRPSFVDAAPPQQAESLFNLFVERMRSTGLKVETGRFQQHMLVEIHNDGPVTLLLDSKRQF